jgi:hypothetical protein
MRSLRRTCSCVAVRRPRGHTAYGRRLEPATGRWLQLPGGKERN